MGRGGALNDSTEFHGEMVSLLRDRFVQVQNRPADHRPCGCLVDVHIGRHVCRIRQRHLERRRAAIFKVTILLFPEIQQRVQLPLRWRAARREPERVRRLNGFGRLRSGTSELPLPKGEGGVRGKGATGFDLGSETDSCPSCVSCEWNGV